MTQAAIEAHSILKEKSPNFTPRLAIILGSGLGGLVDEIQNPIQINFDELPGFHKPEVEGHAGQFVLGTLEKTPVLCLQGRAHFYEGIEASVLQTMIRTCKLSGCESLLITGATGSLDATLKPGSVLLVKDHLNFQFRNPLVGLNDERFGPRFIGMDDAYDIAHRDKFRECAKHLELELREGVYISTLGPSFETPTEIRAFRRWGADVVGMSVVPEVIVARHCGLRVAALALVTNLAAGLHEGVLSHEETLKGAELGAENLQALIRGFCSFTQIPATPKKKLAPPQSQ